MNCLEATAAGMFTPQEKGNCKLTIIIPESDEAGQNFAFQHLRHKKVKIFPASSEEAPQFTDSDVETIGFHVDRINEHTAAIQRIEAKMNWNREPELPLKEEVSNETDQA